MKVLTRVIKKVTDFILAMILASMAIVVFVNVVLRYGFHSGLYGSADLARILFIWLIFIGAAALMFANNHLGVDVVLKRLPPGVQRIVGVLSRLLMGVALGLVFYGCWQQMVINNDTMSSGVISYPMSWPYAAGVFAGAGGLLSILRDIANLLRGDLQCLYFNEIEDETSDAEEFADDARVFLRDDAPDTPNRHPKR